MKYLSLCSGIEAATVAWHPLGWEAVAYSEIERFPSEVLAHHYPHTPNLGDMTKFKEWNLESNVDLLVGGTPCQSFSVAGLRKGLDDPRGNLMLTYLAIADKFKPKWIVWENVPGVLSSNGGKDFGIFLGALGELGYGFAYRILDAQYFGVAQRRRRVFVVGYLGDWRRAAAVLFERHSLQGHPAPSREKREDSSATITARTGISRNNQGELVGWPADISSTLNASFGSKLGLENQHINADCPMFVPTKAFYESSLAQYKEADLAGTAKASGGVAGGGSETFIAQPVYEMHGQDSRVRDLGETCNTVTSKWGTGGGNVPVALQPAYGIPGNWIGRKPENGGNATEPMYDIAPCLTKADQHGVAQPMAVRRLTPVECERLQGFGDNYTDIKSKNKPTPDGPRYKALGNSMAVPVMAWIGQRIEQVEAICKQNR
jgi:DNA (cytosine-5)-methyltransferase 1